MATPALEDGRSPGFFGVYPAIVTNIVDRERLGRIEVKFPALGDDGERDVRAWATLCSPYADKEQGLEVLPEVGSQVVVAFEAGNFRRPYIIGACWNGKAALPQAPAEENNLRVLKTRSASKLEFDDTRGAEKVSLTMKSGHQIVMDNAAQEITVKHSNGSVVKLSMAGVQVTTSFTVEVKASAVNVTTPVATFSGVVQCKTVVTDAFVVSPAYTPGVGNLL